MPVFIILIFSIALIARVLWKKYRMRQRIQWRRQRKMTIQLISISFLYIVFIFPFTLLHFMVVCGYPLQSTAVIRQYSIYSSYFVTLILPIFFILSCNELRPKLFNMLHIHRQRTRVVTAIVPANNRIQVQ